MSAQSRTSIELQVRGTQDDAASNDTVRNGVSGDGHFEGDNAVVQQLAPVDRGRPAWTVLMAAFILEALLWGFPSSFGVFQNHYSELPQFKGANIAVIGTVAQGLFYLGAPASAVITKRFPKYHRYQIWFGWPMCILGLLLGSFTTTFGGLVATQGFLYGFGFVILTYPIISMVNEWWVSRKGMAFGLISSASGLAGIVMPFILESLLKRYGYHTTLRASAVGMALITAPLIPFLKGRLPAAERSTMAKTNWSFMWKPLFWIYAMSTLVQGLGFFYPAIYLPSYATVVGLTSTQGALLLAIMCASQVLGQFAFGYLSDGHFHVSSLAIVCGIVSTVATLALWGTAKSEALLIIFSLIYGFFSYGFGTMRVAMGAAVSDDASSMEATYAIFVFLQGIGNVLVGPISAVLLSADVNVSRYGALGYRSLVVFTGACMFVSASILGFGYMRPCLRS